jgi:hypothetical protein
MNRVKEKDLYQTPKLEITKYLESDVISTSGLVTEWDDSNVNSNGWT